VGERLLGPAAVGCAERPHLALGVVAGLRERDARHGPRRVVRSEQEADLLFQRDVERILFEWRLVGAVGCRPVVEADPISEGGRAGLRDPDGVGRDPIGLAGREDARAREAPGPVDDDPDAEALALAGRWTAVSRERSLRSRIRAEP